MGHKELCRFATCALLLGAAGHAQADPASDGSRLRLGLDGALFELELREYALEEEEAQVNLTDISLGNRLRGIRLGWRLAPMHELGARISLHREALDEMSWNYFTLSACYDLVLVSSDAWLRPYLELMPGLRLENYRDDGETAFTQTNWLLGGGGGLRLHPGPRSALDLNLAAVRGSGGFAEYYGQAMEYRSTWWSFQLNLGLAVWIGGAK